MRAVLLQLPHTHIKRGDASLKKERLKRQGNIVHTMKIGKTTIHFCDDYVAKTSEEVERVLDDMHASGWAIIESLHQKSGDMA